MKKPLTGFSELGRPEVGTMPLLVTVPAEISRAASRLSREYSGRKLETVVAALVTDLAVAAERPGSWEYERVTAWLGSHVWEVEPRDGTH